MNFLHEFPLDPELCYLNHAAVAPWPHRTAAAVTAFAKENSTLGASHYPQWLKVEKRLRERLAQLINASCATDIALAKNTSEALSIIAYGLAWRAGDEIIISNEEFPSNRIVWESLRDQGVITRIVTLDPAHPEQSIVDALTPATRLVSLSSVQYASGRRMDLEALGTCLQARQIFFCVDAIQSLGALPFDVQTNHADFVVADGHKWMLGPEGIALLYVKPAVRDRLRLRQFGWHMVKHRGDYDRPDWDVADDATRFECGSPNMLGIHALEASLSLLQEIGIDQISIQVLDHTHYLRHQLATLPGIELLSPGTPTQLSGITSFRSHSVAPALLHAQLMARQVICACRGGGVRFSPHFYSSRATLDRALEHVRDILAKT